MQLEQKIILRRNKTIHNSYELAIAKLNSISIEIGEVVSARYKSITNEIKTLVVIGSDGGYDIVNDEELDWVEY